MPKLDLHRHLEGCIRPRTAFELGRASGTVPAGATLESFRTQVVVDRPTPLLEVLKCFDVVRKPFVSAEAVTRVTREALADAAQAAC